MIYDEMGKRTSETEIGKMINEARKASMSNMWLICMTMTFCVLVDTVYTLVVRFVDPSDDCNP